MSGVIISVRPFLAAMWIAARPRAFRASICSFTFECEVCVLSSCSRQSFLPQKTAEVSGVHPLSSRKFISAPFLIMALTSGPHKDAILRTRSWLSFSFSGESVDGFASGSNNRFSTLILLERAARNAAQSISLLCKAGFALAFSKSAMKRSSDLSAAYNNVWLPVQSTKFGSARASKSCLAHCWMSGRKRFTPMAFSTNLALDGPSKACCWDSFLATVSSTSAWQMSRNFRFPRMLNTPSM
mmetsp:Transcript_102786/g.257852  ORF Transcript_102786/g.257852 Transcript_102786/m.257852 type:complete len:241 (-) Transcript_102786:377-1099(-)